MFNFHKKEAPLLGLQGSGGGLGFLAGSGGGEPTFTIYMMGGGARTRDDAIRAGYSEATITIPTSEMGSYTRLEVVVGEGGSDQSAPSSGDRRYGGGGSGNNTPRANGSPGGGGSFVFLSSPTSTSVFNSSGKNLQVPVANADARCLIAAGGSGGRDMVDGSGGGGGGGLMAQGLPALPGTVAQVNRTGSSGSNGAYNGLDGAPGSWSSGGGGGGYQGGLGSNDYDGSGGCGYVGHTNPAQSQPFSGPSPVNPGFEYTNAFAIGNAPAGGSPYNPYTVPSAGSPYIPASAGGRSTNSSGEPGIVVVVGPSGTTTFNYTGSHQYYNFS